MKPAKRPKLTRIPPELACVSDYEHLAKDFVPHSVYEYIAGGGADDISLHSNRRAFDRIELFSRVLSDCTGGTTALSLLDEPFRHPVLLAPVAYQKLVHPDGERATAQAADALQAGFIASTMASVSLEAIAAELSGNKWFQLYVQDSREGTLSLLRRAEAAGYTALVVTVDAPINGLRNRAQRAGFALPQQVQAVNLGGLPQSSPPSLGAEHSIVFQGLMASAPTWADLVWLRRQTALPIIVKGILHPADAVRVADMGLAGVVVSNHGGRTLDGLPASISALPAVRAALGPDFLVLLDGGIRRGTDVFKALALGANAVLVGRPQVYALAVAGALGVAHMLRLLREELEVTMALTGCPTLAHITMDALYPSEAWTGLD
ncbi:MAG: alpha-hydroxy-acid oxidizing protein [Desulfurellaceae bacterium]|nr:alpha-hydroxy-acid oxidizing protein [Desulfurellaceae bacterium]